MAAAVAVVGGLVALTAGDDADTGTTPSTVPSTTPAVTPDVPALPGPLADALDELEEAVQP
jgi:hypothetical protein